MTWDNCPTCHRAPSSRRAGFVMARNQQGGEIKVPCYGRHGLLAVTDIGQGIVRMYSITHVPSGLRVINATFGDGLLANDCCERLASTIPDRAWMKGRSPELDDQVVRIAKVYLSADRASCADKAPSEDTTNEQLLLVIQLAHNQDLPEGSTKPCPCVYCEAAEEVVRRRSRAHDVGGA